jgi:VanZ family protein
MTPYRPPIGDARPARTSGLATFAYVAAIVYGTLYPWRGWRSIGLSGFEFLGHPWPRYWTWFDVLGNVAVYVPLGVLLMRAWPRMRAPLGRLGLAVAAGSALSLGLEALQTFLPGRVPSRLDWLANTAGTALGALALPAWRRLRRGQTPAPWQRPAVWRPHAGPMLVLALVWLAVQIVPQRVLFETGAVVEPLRDLLREQAESPASGGLAPLLAQAHDTLTPLLGRLQVADDTAAQVEIASVAVSVIAVGLILVEALMPGPLRPLIVGATLAAGVAVQAAAATWLYDGWGGGLRVSPSAQGGIVLGVIALSLLASAQRRTRQWLLLAALVLGVVLANVLPPSAYHGPVTPEASQAAWRNVQALAQAVALFWPIGALVTVALWMRSSRPGRAL